jgi:MoxR-like ATPase
MKGRPSAADQPLEAGGGSLDIERSKALLERALGAITQVVRGKAAVIELALVAILAEGHLLLEDVPGVGKTTLARALAAISGGEFRRVQCTSDLLPGDITGVNILAAEGSGLHFRPGPIFANVVLADEINRETQSALLEAMNEGCVTVDGVSHELPQPFLVLATQNPHDHQGTFVLPDAQLDRFLMCLEMGYPDRENERMILRSGGLRRATFGEALTAEELQWLQGQVDSVRMSTEVEDYLLDLVQKTRSDAGLVRGVSTRGAEALYRASLALALARSRDFVIPEDIRELAVPVLAHRVQARAEGVRLGEGGGRVIQGILRSLRPPG